MVKKICLDTNFLIWAIKKEANAGQEYRLETAASLLRVLKAQGSALTLIIPSVVLMEYLMPVPENLHQQLMKTLSAGFNLVSFDAASAKASASLWHSRQSDFTIKTLRETETKNKIKIDCQIVGTALSRKVDCICSEDVGLKKFSGSDVEVLTMDELLDRLDPQPALLAAMVNNVQQRE